MVEYDPDRLEYARKLLGKYVDLSKEYYNVEYEHVILASVEYHYNKNMIILIHEIEGDYQGDGIIIGVDDDLTFYYCMYGFGSCSGCDALEACGGKEEELVIEMSCIPLQADKVLNYLNNELKNTSWQKELVQNVIDKWNVIQNDFIHV